MIVIHFNIQKGSISQPWG